jgi:photosystem II stability/assembly factor-like uncharacterized protein
MPEPLEQLYQDARTAIREKDYARAGELLRQVLQIDENYKDASRLLAQTVSLRRRRWYNQPMLWGILGLAAMVGIAVWIAPRLGSFPARLVPTSTAANTVVAQTVNSTPALLATSSPIPTPFLLAWHRVSMGQELPRDPITAIVIDPKDPDVIYAGTKNAGIYKSIDGGLSWLPAQNGLGDASISSLFIDPVDRQTLYTPTRGALYKTTDGGENWREFVQAAYPSDRLTFFGIDPLNNQHLYYVGNNDVQRSIDGGSSWQTVKTDSECPGDIYTFTTSIAESGVLFAFGGSNWRTYCQAGLYRSSNGGKQWSLIGLEDINTNWIATGLDMTGKQVLYAAGDDDTLRASHDYGATWAVILSSGCRNYPQYNLWVDPLRPTTVFCGAQRSDDAGITWKDLPTVPPDNITAMAILNDGKDIFAGTTAGLFISKDGGISWAEGSGLAGILIEPRADPSNFSTWYTFLDANINYSGNILYRSANNGLSWNQIAVTGSSVMAISNNGDIFRVEGYQLMISQDKGSTWNASPLPLDESVTGFGTNPAIPGMVYVAYSLRAFFSTDQGLTWQESTIPTGDNYINVRFFFDPNQAQKGYMITHFIALQTSDAGNTWQKCAEQVSWTPYTQSILVIDPRNSDRIILAGLGIGLFFSKDGCQTWQPINNGLGSLFVNSIALDPNHPETVYAGTNGGAYISYDFGQSWSQINDGLLGATVVYSIVVDKESNVFAATPYGIFKLEEK